MRIKRLFKFKNKKGAALMYTMMFLMLMSVIIVSFSLISVNMYKSTAVSASKEQSFLFAKTIGQVFAMQLAEDLDASSIVTYLETNAQAAPTVRGTAKISFDPNDDNIRDTLAKALKNTNLTKDDLTGINIPDAQLKFYFKTTCAKCGATLEDLPVENNEYYCQSPTCKNKKVKDKIINKKYLYLDVTVSYNGATEVVTTVFTYLDQEDFTQTMYDLFSVYNIYSTYPSEMEFNFTGDLVSGSISPNVYLYNGVDSESEGYGEISRDTYVIRANVKANLTSTGDVKLTSQSGSILSVSGRITSYGSMILSNIETTSMYMKGDLTVEASAKVTSDIYARNNVTIYGNGGSAYSVNGTIYAMGNVVISGAKVNRIVGGPGCNVTLRNNASCTSISTGGAVKLENSTVFGNVVCDGNLDVTNSIITGRATTKGDCTLVLNSSSKETVIGATSIANVSSTYRSTTTLDVEGNVTFRNTVSGSNNSKLAVNGGVMVGGSIRNPNTVYGESIITGGITVKGFLNESIQGYDCHVCYLVGLNVYGGVKLENSSGGKACIPLFGSNNSTTPSVPAKISGAITINGNLILGDYFTDVFAKENDDNQSSSFDFRGESPRYINLFGATISIIQTQSVGTNSNPTQIFIKNGKITGGLIANQVVLSNVEIAESAKINASGRYGTLIAVDNTVLKGQIVSTVAFSLHRGSVLSDTKDGFVHVSGYGSSTDGVKGTAYIDGEIYGELVVGTTANSGYVVIKKNALLGGSDFDKATYVNGNLLVKDHPQANITNNPETFAPRLRTQNNNGHKIYLANGKAQLNGWVYDLYVRDGTVETLDEVAGACGKPYIKGTTYVETAFVFIGRDGLDDSEGATYTNNDVIVYIYEDTPELGSLTISGTLVVRRGATLHCKSLKVNKIISDYDGQALTPTNMDVVKQDLESTVRTYDFNNAVIKNLDIKDDTQINMISTGTVTVENSTFGGWVKFKNATGRVVFQNSFVLCSSYTTYKNDNDNYKGCLDVAGADLSIVNSFVGGTASTPNVSSSSARNEGNVYCKKLSMNGGIIYGTAYTTYAESLTGGAQIAGGLYMSTTTYVTLNWSNVKISNFVYGPCVNVLMDSGVLCGTTVNSTNQSTNLTTNEHYVYLNDLTMSGSAALAQYTSVYIRGGVDTALSGSNIGNVYAKTQKLNIFKSSAVSTVTVKGFVYCEGDLTYASNVTPSAEKGLYAGNSTVVISTDVFSAIKSGGVNLPNFTGDMTFNAVTGHVNAPKANSLTFNGSVLGDVKTNTLIIENKSTSVLQLGNAVDNGANTIDVQKGFYVYTSSGIIRIYSFVNCGMLAVNMKKSGGNIPTTQQSIAPSSLTRVTTGSTTYVYFYENVLVNRIGTSTTEGGNAFLSNASFMGKSTSSYHGATLFTARSVLAMYCNFYGAGYQNSTKHTYTSSLNTYNTTSSTNYTTNYGSVVAWLESANTTSKTSYSYGVYFDNVKVYSNITQLDSSLSSYVQNSELGEAYNADNQTELNRRNYTKLYYFAGSLTLNNSKVRGIKYSFSGDPLAYTLLDVRGSLTLTSTTIGEDFSEYTYEDYSGGIKNSTSISREHNQRSIKGIYVGSSMTIDASSTVYINIYVKGALTNRGNIILQKKHTIGWDAFGLAGIRHYYHYCGGEVQVGSYTNYGYMSILEMGQGVSQFLGSTETGKHNTEAAKYDWCTANASAFKVGGTISTCPQSKNLTTSTTVAKTKSGIGTTRVETLTMTINAKNSNPILGVEWDNTESVGGKMKTPSSSINITVSSQFPTAGTGDKKTAMPTTILDTSNRAYWYPQAIPLRWYLPTQTTAGESVTLNTNSTMTIQEVQVNEGVWSHLTNASASTYMGLRYANRDDAYYYRVSSKNIDDILSDLNGRDMMVLTKTSYFNIFGNKKKRPVGLVFFNSGIVSSSAFDYTYRASESVSDAQDSSGRWYWGDNGNAANDVLWTFFTCEDPRNPYGSKAKDLHIVLPKNTKLVWQKDKDSCVSIIGNGRVFLYLQDNTDIKIIGNGFTHAFHDTINKVPGVTELDNFFKQWTNGDATFNIFGGVRYVAVQNDPVNPAYSKTYYQNGQIVMDQSAFSLASSRSDISVQLQPRMYIVGTGKNIRFEVQDFQTAAYVYMPAGYSYGDKNARNKFVISARDSSFQGSNYWDVYGIYVCDNFEYANDTSGKVRYFKTSPDLSDTSFMKTYFSGGKATSTSNASSTNKASYRLAEFWDYPTDLPVSSMNWYYRGLALS